MGADYSPLLCNIYLTFWEYKALIRQLRLINQVTQRAQILMEWRYFFRMMDDVCLLNAPTLSRWISQPHQPGDDSSHQWVYPTCLSVETTADLTSSSLTQPDTFHYLDLLFTIHPDCTYTFTIYLPESKLPFKPIKYISPWSNRPSNLVYNTTIGQLYRLIYLNSTKTLFLQSASHMYRELLSRGYSVHKLKRCLMTWLYANQGHLPNTPLPNHLYPSLLRCAFRPPKRSRHTLTSRARSL